MIYSLGILVKKLGSNQMGLSLCNNINKLVKFFSDIEPIIFIEDFDRTPQRLSCAIMLKKQAVNFSGAMISTCPDTSIFAQTLPNLHAHYYYLYNLDWMYSRRELDYYTKATKPNLIVRDESVSEIVTKLWKKPSFVLNDWSYRELSDILYESGEQKKHFEFDLTYGE